MGKQHEILDSLPKDVQNLHRAYIALVEAVEAIDFNTQRMSMCSEADLKSALGQNRSLAIGQAVGVMRWLYKNVPELAASMQRILDQTPTEKSEGVEEAPNLLDAFGIGTLSEPQSSEVTW